MFTTVVLFLCRPAPEGTTKASTNEENAGHVFLHFADALDACSNGIYVIPAPPIHISDGDVRLLGRGEVEALARAGEARSRPWGTSPSAATASFFEGGSREVSPGSTWTTVPANAEPYRAPIPVEAAGGIIVRQGGSRREVLLIHRRGAWDLPKGKRDANEALDECARREVCEELGINDVVIERPLGRTVHGYVDGARYAVKTTHWYQMQTESEDFEPEEREGITAVSWMPWEEATKRLDFPVLRRHLVAVGPLISGADSPDP